MPNERNSRPPTMTDVARLAGVSQTTVSLVINNVSTASIPLETRDRVRDAVQALGYRPNTLAQSLRTNRSHLLGFITDEIATTPFAGDVLKGAQEAGWARRKILLAVNTDGSPDLEAAAIDRLLQRQVDGIIYARAYHQMVSPPAAIARVPTILVNCYAEDRALPSVVPNEVQGGTVATLSLLERGHRRIGFLATTDSVPARDGRLAGCKEALQTYGVPFDQGLILDHPAVARGGYDATHELLGRSTGVTAIVCFSDIVALGAYDAIWERGLRVPRDVSVVGFGNQELIAAGLLPPLSTVAPPYYEMGRWAVDYLVRHSEHTDGTGSPQSIFDCLLLERASIASPGDQGDATHA